MLNALLSGASLGLFAAVQPGAFQAFLMARVAERGWRRALPLTLAPLVSDGPIVALVLLLLARTPEWFTAALHLVGGAFVLTLAVDAVRKLRRPPAETVSVAGGFVQGMLINALNPGPWLFWGIVIGPLAVDLWRAAPPRAVALVLGFYLTLIGGFVLLVSLFGLAARGGERWRLGMRGVAVALLAGFGALLVVRGAARLLG